HAPAASLKFDRVKQELYYGQAGPISAFSGAFKTRTDTFTQVEPGEYPLQIPAYPSAQTRAAYGAYTGFHKTWFRIGLSSTDSRFVHVGLLSEGCVTVRAFYLEPDKNVAKDFQDFALALKSTPGGFGYPYPKVRPPIGSWTAVYN